MKKTLLMFSLLGLMSTQLSAQFEIKLSPVPLLFGGVFLSLEQAISPSFGIDVDGVFVEGFGGFNISGKYYFDPRRGIDRLHAGVFTGTLGDSFGAGFMFGTKVVSARNLLFEAGLGLGRSFDGGVIGYVKLHVGYRFYSRKGYRGN